MQQQFNTLIDGLHQREKELNEHPMMQIAFFLHDRYCKRKGSYDGKNCDMTGEEKYWTGQTEELLNFVGSVIPSDAKDSPSRKRKLKMEK